MSAHLESSEIQRLAAELLGGREISDFAIGFIHNMKATEESIRAVHAVLTELGLSEEKIATYAQLLGRDPETIQRNYGNLRRIGLSEEKIATNAHLLSRDPETIQRNYGNLRRIGLSEEKIATYAQLLGRDPETIQRNYSNHIGLLGGRECGRSILTTFASLLGRSPDGFTATFQHLAYIDRQGGNGNAPIYEKNPILLGTTSAKQREKMAFLLREIYDYRKLGSDEKKAAIKGVYRLVSDNPQLLACSIPTLERKVDAIRRKAA